MRSKLRTDLGFLSRHRSRFGRPATGPRKWFRLRHRLSLSAPLMPCYLSAPMKDVRPITLWLAAVIVMIAASLMPCGAQAHDGHRAAAHAQAAPAGTTVDIDLFTGLGASTRSSSSVSIVLIGASAVSEAVSIACACPDCSAGGACGHASSCCASALAPSPIAGLAPMASREPARAGDGPPLLGIFPDRQARPPRRRA